MHHITQHTRSHLAGHTFLGHALPWKINTSQPHLGTTERSARWSKSYARRGLGPSPIALELNVIGFEHIKELYANDPSFATPYAKSLTHTSWEQYYIKDGYLMRANKLCIPESSLRLLLLQQGHGGGLMGHFGRNKTFATLSKNYNWPKMYRDVSRFTNRCSTCRKAKSKAQSHGL